MKLLLKKGNHIFLRMFVYTALIVLLPIKQHQLGNSRSCYGQDDKQPLTSSRPDGLDFNVMECVDTFYPTTPYLQ